MDTRDLGSDFFIFLFFFLPRGENPHGSNENSNTIYRPDLTHCSDAGEAVHSRLREIEVGALVFSFKISNSNM